MKQYKVVVRCITYNHSRYIEEAMNGFCMQQTDFPFVCVIVDDASTDGEQDVIRSYLQTNFDHDENGNMQTEETDDYVSLFARHKKNTNCFFEVFFLKNNHYQAGKSKQIYFDKAAEDVQYVAICEGDDYWIDVLKLQKQVSFLDHHPSYTMVCNRIKLFSQTSERYIGEQYCYKKSQNILFRDIVYRTGLFIPTCSIVYRKDVTDNYPDYCRNCVVGDYPLQIMCGIKGETYYFNDLMSVYRVCNGSSWMGEQKWKTADDNRLKVLRSEIEMFEGFMKDNPHHEKIFKNKIAEFINKNLPSWRSPAEETKRYVTFFKEDIGAFSFFWKIDFYIKSLRVPGLYHIYEKPFFKKYRKKERHY